MTATLPEDHALSPLLYQREFPSFVLDVPIPDGFVDISWHNDTMPSFQKKFADGSLTLWIDFSHLCDREIASGKRFVLSRSDAHDEHIEEIAITDNFAEIEAAIVLRSDVLTEKGN